MTLPEIATAYARIDKVWRSATRQSKQIYLVQLAQLDAAAAADLDLQQPEVRDLVRGIRLRGLSSNGAGSSVSGTAPARRPAARQ